MFSSTLKKYGRLYDIYSVHEKSKYHNVYLENVYFARTSIPFPGKSFNIINTLTKRRQKWKSRERILDIPYQKPTYGTNIILDLRSSCACEEIPLLFDLLRSRAATCRICSPVFPSCVSSMFRVTI